MKEGVYFWPQEKHERSSISMLRMEAQLLKEALLEGGSIIFFSMLSAPIVNRLAKGMGLWPLYLILGRKDRATLVYSGSNRHGPYYEIKTINNFIDDNIFYVLFVS